MRAWLVIGLTLLAVVAIGCEGREIKVGTSPGRNTTLDRIPPAPPPQPRPLTPSGPPAVAQSQWRYIIIHHSATDRGNAAAFDKDHRAKGWDELGYHFVIDNGNGGRDGQVEVGPRWTKQKHGAHTKTADERFNNFGIGICLVGNFDNYRPTPAELESAYALAAQLAARYRIPAGNILGHGEAVASAREGGGTRCPGRYLDMDAFRRVVAARLASGR